MNARCIILFPLFLALLLSGCATHEWFLSGTLKPVVSSGEVKFPIKHFRARTKGPLEVGGRVILSEDDYKSNFDLEIETTAALLASLIKSELTFKYDWRQLVIELWYEYSSELLWKSTFAYVKVRISRATMLELRTRNVPVSEYPKFWRFNAMKVGPPNYVPYRWSSDDAGP